MTFTEVLNIVIGIVTLCGVVFSLISTLVIQREQLKVLREDFTELTQKFYTHKENLKIHFDETTAKQVELRLTADIRNLKETVGKIETKVDKLLERK
jgi:uncharacterized membrane protein